MQQNQGNPSAQKAEKSPLAVRIVLVVFAAFLVFCLVFFFVVQYRLSKTEAQKELLQKRLSEKEERILELQWDNAHADDNETLRKWLRLHGYCDPGDIFCK